MHIKRAMLKPMDRLLTGQNYESPYQNQNNTPISVQGRKVGTMNTYVVTDNSTTTSNKLVLFAMSNSYNRKLVMLLVLAVLTALSAYFTISFLVHWALQEFMVTTSLSALGGYVFYGQFQEFKILQASKILDARIEYLKRNSVIEKGDYDTSLLEVDLSATRNAKERATLFKDFTRRGDVIDLSIIEGNHPDFATETELIDDKKKGRLLNPPIELLQDGYLRIQLEPLPVHVEDIKKLQRTYDARLRTSNYTDADKQGYERATNILNSYINKFNQKPVVVAIPEDKLKGIDELTFERKKDGNYVFEGNTKEWWTIVLVNNKTHRIIGAEKAKIKSFISLYKLAKSKKNKLPDPTSYDLQMFEVIPDGDTNTLNLEVL